MNEFEQIIQMVKERNTEGLEALPKKSLVAAIIKLFGRYERAKANSQRDEQWDYIIELQKKLINDCKIGKFNITMDRMEQSLIDAEQERVKLQEKNEELEDELQRIQEDVDELEKKLKNVPRVGRPEKYDAAFRESVKNYHADGHTYRETSNQFNISTNTVGRFLKE